MKKKREDFPKNDRWYYFFKGVNGSSVSELINSLEASHQYSPKTPSVLFVASRGGELGLGMGFFHWVRFANIPLITVGMGEVASSGVLMFLSGTKRFVLPDTHFYFHPGETGITRKSSPSEGRGLVKSFEYEKQAMHKIIRQETHISKKKLRKIDDSCGTLVDKQLLKFGFASRILKTLDDY